MYVNIHFFHYTEGQLMKYLHKPQSQTYFYASLFKKSHKPTSLSQLAFLIHSKLFFLQPFPLLINRHSLLSTLTGSIKPFIIHYLLISCFPTLSCPSFQNLHTLIMGFFPNHNLEALSQPFFINSRSFNTTPIT